MNKLLNLIASAAMIFSAAGVQAQETAEPEAKTYNGYLNISMMGSPVATNQKTTVEITPTGESTCDFLLPDLTLEGLGSLGSIDLKEVGVDTDFFGNATYSKASTPMTLLDGAINAKVSLDGSISSMGEVSMTIPVIWVMSETEELPIEVSFSTKPTGTEYSGYLNIDIEGLGAVAINSKASVYIVEDSETTCTFLLPDLTLEGLGSIGDISLPGVTIEDNSTAKSYTKSETDMALLDGAINAKVSLDGTITTAGIATMTIPVVWTDANMKINVTFSTKPVGEAIKGYLTIGFEGAAPMEINTPATVYITETGEGACNFLLPDLSIMGGFMNLGDVALSGVKVAEADGTTTYTHEGAPMSIYLQGQELKTTVKLDGTANADGVVDMMIPVIWHIDENTDMPINVKFSTVPEGNAIEGYLSIAYDGEEPFEVDTPATVYITDPVDGACTFLLPNLTIMGGLVSLGDIALTGVNVAEADGVKTYTHSGSEMTIDFLGNILSATVKLNGTINAAGDADMLIPVIAHFPGDPDNDIESQDLAVNVTFSTKKTSSITAAKADDSNVEIYGVEGAVKVAGVEGTVSVYTTVGVKVAEEPVNGEATIAAPKGIAIVATPARTAKVVVK